MSPCLVGCRVRLRSYTKEGTPPLLPPIGPLSFLQLLRSFRKIVAVRMEKFCLSNDIIDPSSQKGFLQGINGAVEHIFTITAMIEHARSNGLPLTLTFIDLQNAFGSISHSLVSDILTYLQIPSPMIQYVSTMYANLRAFVSTKSWSTSPFPITRRVFQGDTMSPIIFLMVFNPILKLVQSLSSPGFTFRLPIPDSHGLPEIGCTIYVEWDEENSDEPAGWYRCEIVAYNPNGAAQLSYPDGATEVIDLSTITWTFAHRSSKRYRTLDSRPPHFIPVSQKRNSVPKQCKSLEHKVKAYTDDLAIINIDQQSHMETLRKVDSCCLDLDLQIRADKCVTYSFNGHKVDKRFKISLSSGDTQNISTSGTKFLGRYIAASAKQTSAISSTTVRSKFESALRALRSKPIHGEYKHWVYQYYLAPSFHFYLAVNTTSSTSIKQMEAMATKAIKKWLKLPRNVTQATYTTQKF